MSGSSSSSPVGETFVHYTDRIPVRYCKCGRRLGFYTNWKNNDDGRRYYGCGTQREQGCGYREWFDPPSCERANKIISGLLRKLDIALGNTSSTSIQSDSATNHAECKAKIKSLKKTILALHAKSEMLTRGCCCLLVISICLVVIIWYRLENGNARNVNKFRKLTEL